MTEPTHAQAVAALRAYADWLEAHPDVPAPQYLEVVTHHHISSGIDVDESRRLALEFAEKYGAVKKSNGRTRWVTLSQTFPGSPMKVEQTLYLASPKPEPDGW